MILNRVISVTAQRTHLDHTLKELFFVQLITERNYVVNPPGEIRQSFLKQIAERDTEVLNLVEERKKIAGAQGLKDLAAFMKSYETWKTVNRDVVKLIEEGHQEQGTQLLIDKGRPIRIEVTETIDSMVRGNTEDMATDRHDAEATYRSSRNLMLTGAGLSLLFGIALSIVVLRGIGKAINQVIVDLNSNSTQVTQASHQIATTSTQLADASSEQAASLEETVATLEELTSMIKLNSENAVQASKMSQETEEAAKEGDTEVRSLLVAMEEISSDSKKIEEIINVIDDIAFQTNLLALNASVEAARAGEQGKGFAVVAEAVRSLAQRSATAAKEITDLIKGSVQKIDVGSQKAQSNAEILTKIVGYSHKVTEVVKEIANASQEQAHGISQISTAMNQLDQATQSNAAASEEASAAAQELSAQADQLTQTVVVLDTTIKGSTSVQNEHSV